MASDKVVLDDQDFANMDVDARVKSLADVEVNEIGQRYKMQEELGSGAQATVYKGQNKKTGGKVAIKVLESQELEDDELYDALRMEINLLRQLNHPYVVNLLEVVRDKEHIYIIQECLGGGELFEHLLAKGPFKEDYALAIFAQVPIPRRGPAADHTSAGRAHAGRARTRRTRCRPPPSTRRPLRPPLTTPSRPPARDR